MKGPEIELPDRFRVIAKLGDGGMGVVYRAYDSKMENEIALKVILPERIARLDIQRRFENEIRLLHRIGAHSNVVGLHERIDLKGGGTALVMELVRGEGLDNIIARSRNRSAVSEGGRMTVGVADESVIEFMDWRLALEITLQVLEGLRHIHSREIVTRDIKPSNILIAREKERGDRGRTVVKIADFGIAKLFGEAESDGTAMTALTQEGASMPGTPAYMAPEQVDPKRFGSIGPWTDFYALGATLFEMLTFDLPFSGDSRTEIHMAHCMTQPRFEALETVRASGREKLGLRRILETAMQKETAKRYQHAEDFQRDIRIVLGGGLPDMGTPGGQRKGRPSWLAPVAIVAVVASLGGGGFSIYKSLMKGDPKTENPGGSSSISPTTVASHTPTPTPALSTAPTLTPAATPTPSETVAPEATPTLPPSPTDQPPTPMPPTPPPATPTPTKTRAPKPTSTKVPPTPTKTSRPVPSPYPPSQPSGPGPRVRPTPLPPS